MMSLCPECAHHLYGYPNCEHQFEDGRCTLCGWNGTRSAFVSHLIQRHEMSDDELREELLDFDKRLKELPRLPELKGALKSQLTRMDGIAALEIGARAPEIVAGDTDLTLLVNSAIITSAIIPNDADEAVEIGKLQTLDFYRNHASSSQVRQLEIALDLQRPQSL